MPRPTEIQLHRQSALLDLAFDDGSAGSLTAEYLRVYSPSAEVRGHSPSQAVLQTDKENVAIENIEAVGQYAVRLVFSDGHDTGLYTWDYLYELLTNKDNYWRDYLQRLQAAGKTRKVSGAKPAVQKFNPKQQA